MWILIKACSAFAQPGLPRPLGCCIPAPSSLATVRSHSVAPSQAASVASISPAATNRPILNEATFELVVATPFPCLGEPLKLSAQRSKSVGSGPLWHSSGLFWTTLWHKELNQPLRNSSKLVPERIDPAIPVPIWMLGRWSNYISASSSVVDSGQDAGSIADARELHVVVKALSRRDQGAA
jgi:hypothetical protein